MSVSVKANNLFMNKVKTPSEDLGILNLGKHCFKCSELDFLPFHCEFCNHTYCSKHRGLETHDCVGRAEKNHVPKVYSGPTAASLFPDHAQRQKKLNELLQPPKATTIALKQLNTSPKSNPVMKLTKFLHLQRLKRASGSKSGIFGKSKLVTPSKVVEIANIKKTAKGAANVNVADRVYLWVLYINQNEDELDKINVQRDRKGVWVLKAWSVGRALDLVLDVMGIVNKNNATQQASERLNLFVVKDEVPVVLETGKKVGAALASGDTLYLVKGSM